MPESARLSPQTAVAGELGTWTLTYQAGSGGLAAGSSLLIHTDSDTDWELPQTTDPESTGFVQLRLPRQSPPAGPLAAVLTIETVKSMRLFLASGTLGQGEEISLVFGSGAGHRMQTFSEPRRYFHIDVLDVSGFHRSLPESPYLRVHGAEAVRLVVINPTEASRGSTVRCIVKAEDQWGNPAFGFAEQVTLSLAGSSTTIRLPHDRAVAWVELPAPGSTADDAFLRPEVQSDSFRASGNPLRVVTTYADRPDAGDGQIWGDFHGGQLVDTGKIPDYYRYARDVSGLTFVSYQRNDHEMSDSEWQEQERAEAEFFGSKGFIPLPGYEWSADTHLGGDRIVLFPRPGLPLLRSSYSGVVGDLPDPDRELPDQSALYNYYRYSNVILLPHVGGRQSRIELHDPQLEPVVEIASTHGTFEWFYLDALRRGYKVGVVAGSDGYTGRPGGEFPGFIARRFSRSGAAAIRVREHSLEGILDALRARRTYATSGPRIYLDLRARGPGIDGRAGLGEEVRARGPVELLVTVAGTAEIDRVDIFRRNQLIHTHVPDGGSYRGRWRALMRGGAAWRCYSGVQWLGRLSLGGAVVADVAPVRFDSPRSVVRVPDAEGVVVWDTTSCGYAHGFEFSLVANAKVEAFDLSVESYLYNGMYAGAALPGRMRISRAPAERIQIVGALSDTQRYVSELGPAGREVVLEPVLEGRPRDLSFTFTDHEMSDGVNAYWIRVTQRDMHNAWSSPVFVSYHS